MTVLHVGKIRWRISSVSSDEGPVGYALSELRKYLGRITRRDLSVTDPSIAGTITLGLRKDLVRADAALLPPSAEGFDGYAVSVSADSDSPRIVLAGDNERATIYAVYDLLERMGCRWFHPRLDEKDPEVVPCASAAKLQSGQWAIASPFRFRWFTWASFRPQTVEEIVLQLNWAAKCRFNVVEYAPNTADEALHRGMMTCAPGHNFGQFLKTEDYFDEHPDWFGMQGGVRQPHKCGGSQFCWSNPEAQDTFVDNVEKYILENPKMHIVDLFGGDGLPACTCPDCAKLNASDWEIQLLNKVTVRMEKSAPDFIIMTGGGYPPVVEPPVKERPHPKLRTMWAHWGRNHGMTYDNPDYDWKANLDSWCDLFEGRFTAFQYYSDHFAEPWVAAPYASTIIGDRKYLLDRKADGIVNLMYPAGYWWNWSLNNYLAGMCFYDAKADPFEIISDYALKYFGEKAGPQMDAYYQEWAHNLPLAYSVRGGATDAERATLADQRRKYIEPALAASADDPVVLYRVSKAEKLHAAAERLMEIPRLRQEVEKSRVAGDFVRAKERLAEARKWVEETAAFIQSLIDLNQGLMDPELLSFFYPGIRASIEQEGEAIEKGSAVKQSTEKKEISATDMVPEHE